MTLLPSGDAKPTVQTPKPSQVDPSPLPQSQELGQALPDFRVNNGGSVTTRVSPFGKSWAHFVAGGLGGMTAAFLTAPLDVLRTRLQSNFYQNQLVASRAASGIPPPSTLPFFRSALLHWRETMQILISIPRTEGWRTYFKGLGPNLAGVVPARAINFFVYGNGKRLISTHLNGGVESAWVHLMAAATAGIATGTATNPIWLVKTRLQLDKSIAEHGGTKREYRNAMDCVVKTVRVEGVRGLYRGLSASYLGVTESTLQWVLYEQMKLWLRERQERRGREMTLKGLEGSGWDKASNLTGMTFAAGLAKLTATVITYPHEVIRTRLRESPLPSGQPRYTGLVDCFKTVWRVEGMAGMYGGLTPHVLRVVPSAAIMFGVYEGVLRALGGSEEGR